MVSLPHLIGENKLDGVLVLRPSEPFAIVPQRRLAEIMSNKNLPAFSDSLAANPLRYCANDYLTLASIQLWMIATASAGRVPFFSNSSCTAVQ
jgi:hypothetical protein